MNKKEILERLVECRATYEKDLTEKEVNMLLENTMGAIQDLLFLENIDWLGEK